MLGQEYSILDGAESEIYEDLLDDPRVEIAIRFSNRSPIEAVRDLVVKLRPDVQLLPIRSGEQRSEYRIAQALVLCRPTISPKAARLAKARGGAK